MKKYSVLVICSLLFFMISVADNKINNSERYSNEAVDAIINDYAEQYKHSFMPAPSEIEEKLYGVWQVIGRAGYRRSSRYQWDGLWGDIIIICDNVFIYGGMPYFNPVYAYYESSAGDMETDTYLDLVWTDERYAELEGTVMLVICEGENGELVLQIPNCLILIDDTLIIERGDSYFELEKVGGVKLYDSNVESDKTDQRVPACDIEQTEVTDREMDNEENYYDEMTNSIMERYKEEYNHSFVHCTTEMEKELYGIWQAKECVGYIDSLNLQGKGMMEEIVIFNENAWILYGTPSFKPVYFFYEERTADMETDKFLGSLNWKDERYVGENGKVIVGLYTEKNNKFGSGHRQDEPFKLIMIEDYLIIESGGLYFEMQKIGEIDMYDLFINVKPN